MKQNPLIQPPNLLTYRTRIAGRIVEKTIPKCLQEYYECFLMGQLTRKQIMSKRNLTEAKLIKIFDCLYANKRMNHK